MADSHQPRKPVEPHAQADKQKNHDRFFISCHRISLPFCNLISGQKLGQPPQPAVGNTAEMKHAPKMHPCEVLGVQPWLASFPSTLQVVRMQYTKSLPLHDPTV